VLFTSYTVQLADDFGVELDPDGDENEVEEDPSGEEDELGTVLDAEAVSADQPSTTRHTAQQTDI